MDEVSLTLRKAMMRLGLLSFLLLGLLVACGSPNTATVAPEKTSTPTPFGSPETEITPPRAEPHILPTPIPTPITLPPAPVLGIYRDSLGAAQLSHVWLWQPARECAQADDSAVSRAGGACNADHLPVVERPRAF